MPHSIRPFVALLLGIPLILVMLVGELADDLYWRLSAWVNE